MKEIHVSQVMCDDKRTLAEVLEEVLLKLDALSSAETETIAEEGEENADI